MVKFTRDGVEYSIRFNHRNSLSAGQPGTTCVIEEDKAQKSVGMSFLAHGDAFNKRIGRKVSAKRAISQYTDKGLRQVMWTELLKKEKVLR